MSITSIIGMVCTIITLILTVALLIARPILDNTKALVKVTNTLENMSKQYMQSERDNKDAHKRIHERIDKDEEAIKGLDNRLSVVESKN